MKKIISVISLVLIMIVCFIGCGKKSEKCAHSGCYIKPSEPYGYCSVHRCKNPDCFYEGIVANSSNDDYYEDFEEEMQRIGEYYKEMKSEDDFDEEDFLLDEDDIKDNEEYKKIVRSLQGYCDKCIGKGVFH